MPDWRRAVDLAAGASKTVRATGRGKRARFIDRVRILAAGGDGGNGVAARFRDTMVENGRANGGSGGRGGDVYIKASHNVSDLLMPSKNFKASRGGNGGKDDRSGRRGERLDITVPMGTVVHRLGEPSLSLTSCMEPPDAPQTVLGELLEDGEELLVARGGQRGRGNAAFQSSLRQHANIAEDGGAGEAVTLLLSLKSIADAGLVGFPNAGKSSLLRALSSATPEVANYAFTTLHPHLGRVRARADEEFTLADIPGIIDGAHENRGLGHNFLRHIERTSLLVYVLDLSESGAVIQGRPSRSPVEQLLALRRELQLYKPGLEARPCILVANKGDTEGAADALTTLRGEVTSLRRAGELPGLLVDSDGSGGSAVTAVSAMHGKNLATLVRRMSASLQIARGLLKAQEEVEAENARRQLASESGEAVARGTRATSLRERRARALAGGGASDGPRDLFDEKF